MKKYSVIIGAIIGLSPMSIHAKTYVLTDTQKNIDVLTNHADYAHDYQIIYHSNFSQPILEEGAKFLAPVSEVSPFNDYAKKGLKDWTTYLGPTKEFDEIVFNLKPLSDQNGNCISQ